MIRILYISFIIVLLAILGIILVSAMGDNKLFNDKDDYVYCENTDNKLTVNDSQRFIDSIHSSKVIP